VVAVARTGPALAELGTTSASIRIEVADAADATVAWSLLDQYEPEVLILVAGANPVMRPLQHQTWETFSVNWHTDFKIAFHWLGEALLEPLPPGRRVVVVSSADHAADRPRSAGGPGVRGSQWPVRRGVPPSGRWRARASPSAPLPLRWRVSDRAKVHRPPFSQELTGRPSGVAFCLAERPAEFARLSARFPKPGDLSRRGLGEAEEESPEPVGQQPQQGGYRPGSDRSDAGVLK
jgi:hypothetical protein